jgi:iron complex outermembrane recepter protein
MSRFPPGPARAVGLRIALAALAALAASVAVIPAQAQTPAALSVQPVAYDIPAQPLSSALTEFARQSDQELFYLPEMAEGKTTNGISGRMSAEQAMSQLLQGTGLEFERAPTGALLVGSEDDLERLRADIESRQPIESGADGAVNTAVPTAASPADIASARRAGVEEIIVTGQKKEERLQDVPIAISAFSMEDLDVQKIEGGFDLLKAVPNVTFSKSNYSSYNFQIRGVGTKAVSATSDPGVAISYNNMPLIRNRLYEQEYFDVARIEVLRGPQGTLYGRNATAGVINMITERADFGGFEGWIKGEVGNYDTQRVSAMTNIPLLSDRLALRLSGAKTRREGFGYNLETQNVVDGRNLWSGRLALAFTPNDAVRVDLTWEHFSEDDDRLRTGKQLCHRDPGPESIPGVATLDPFVRGRLSQGCRQGSLYSPEAFGAPNGLAIPFVAAGQVATQLGWTLPRSESGAELINLLRRGEDPFSATQSRNLRHMESFYDPEYRASADILLLDLEWQLSERWVLQSQTLYNEDEVYSFQDYHRFSTKPTFQDSSGLFTPIGGQGTSPSPFVDMVRGGYYDDPQIGEANRILGFEVSSSASHQFSQEIRLQSDLGASMDVSLGANYTRFVGENDYFLFYNIVTAIAQLQYNRATDFMSCNNFESICTHIDESPFPNVAGDGHNYFRNFNPYELESSAAFGELYWRPSATVKVTLGLRYTDDRKDFTPWPSVLLQPESTVAYSPRETIRQRWTEVTGRLGVDWSPDVPWSDQSLVYGFYSRGYKGGGVNPPSALSDVPVMLVNPERFAPEYVDAFELGMKNTLLNGSMVLNGSAFLYRYDDYQVSKVVDRTIVNENFDATVWGAELEAIWQPTIAFRLNAALGYLKTEIASGEASIDIFNRTQGQEGWMLASAYLQQTSNCILPTEIAATLANFGVLPGASAIASPIIGACVSYAIFEQSPDNNLFASLGFDPREFPEINNGAGFAADLGGNELPNSPMWTLSVGADYTWALNRGWDLTVRADHYRQGESYARVYNLESDRLAGWGSTNFSVTVSQPAEALTFQLYVKNAFDETPITDAFLNSDSTGMTTNIFTLDPRLVGLSIKKAF